jgi:hypothetical protein
MAEIKADNRQAVSISTSGLTGFGKNDFLHSSSNGRPVGADFRFKKVPKTTFTYNNFQQTFFPVPVTL